MIHISFYSLLVGKKIGCTTFDYHWNLDNWLDAYCWFDFNATLWLWSRFPPKYSDDSYGLV